MERLKMFGSAVSNHVMFATVTTLLIIGVVGIYQDYFKRP